MLTYNVIESVFLRGILSHKRSSKLAQILFSHLQETEDEWIEMLEISPEIKNQLPSPLLERLLFPRNGRVEWPFFPRHIVRSRSIDGKPHWLVSGLVHVDANRRSLSAFSAFTCVLSTSVRGRPLCLVLLTLRSTDRCECVYEEMLKDILTPIVLWFGDSTKGWGESLRYQWSAACRRPHRARPFLGVGIFIIEPFSVFHPFLDLPRQIRSLFATRNRL